MTLAGKTIIVTRPRGQAGDFARGLEKAGARVIVAPVIKIAEPASYKGLDDALRNLARYDCVVFTSANTVEKFFMRAKTLGVRPLKRPRYAIGEKTAERLRDFGWPASKLPKVSRGESLAKAIAATKGTRVLLPRAKEAREILPALLRRRGARVDVVEAYRTLGNDRCAPRLRRFARTALIDAVTFTSASTVEHFVRQLRPAPCRRLFRRAAAASIGPVTSAALKARGIAPRIQARRASHESLLEGLSRYFKRRA